MVCTCKGVPSSCHVLGTFLGVRHTIGTLMRVGHTYRHTPEYLAHPCIHYCMLDTPIGTPLNAFLSAGHTHRRPAVDEDEDVIAPPGETGGIESSGGAIEGSLANRVSSSTSGTNGDRRVDGDRVNSGKWSRPLPLSSELI